MLDVRSGWSVDERLADVAELERLGVDWVVSTCCGDDLAAAEDTVRRSGNRSSRLSRLQIDADTGEDDVEPALEALA